MRGQLITWMRANYRPPAPGATNQDHIRLLAEEAKAAGVPASMGGYSSAYYHVRSEMRLKAKRAEARAKRNHLPFTPNTSTTILNVMANLERDVAELRGLHARMTEILERLP